MRRAEAKAREILRQDRAARREQEQREEAQASGEPLPSPEDDG